MNPDNPANRKLLHMTLLVMLAPLYTIVLFAPYTGILPNLAKCWYQGTPFGAPLLYVFLLSCIASMAWLLRRGALIGPVALLLITLVTSGITAGSLGREKIYTLSIGAGSHILGIDVYCNDVHLGKTPFTITQAEFNKKVAPWGTPPDQPIMTLSNRDDNDRYASARFVYVAHDIFEQYGQWPPDHKGYSRDTDKETLAQLKQSKYWWRFEKNGCIGLSSLSNFSNSAGGTNNRITIDLNPNITFLSVEEHLDALLAQLRADNLQPTGAWLDHFLKYKDLLFLGFHQKVVSDHNLQPALDAIVRTEFNLPATPSESDCRRVVEEIVNRAATSHCFTVPSLESLGIVSAAQAHSQPIIDCFLEPIKTDFAGLRSNGTRGSGALITYRRSGPRARLLPLEYAIKQTTPPQLFDCLVYMARGGDHMDLLANYPREELVWLFSHYLRSIEQQGGHRRDSRINSVLRLCSQIVNPLLENKTRQFVRDNTGKRVGMGRHYVDQFVETRINHPKIEQGELANWIFHWAPLDDREKLAFLRQIQDPNACSLYSMAARRSSNRTNDIMYQLGRQPNPAFDTLIAETYNASEEPQGRGRGSQSFTLALVKTDTPAMREFITEKWNQDSNTRTRMMNHLKARDWRQPHMNWLVPLITGLTEKRDRVSGAKLLSRIDTPEAYELAERWAADSHEDIAAVATAQLAVRDERKAQQQQQLALTADLLAGKLKPDDLLTSTTAYTWNGIEYVPDTVTP
ncbi:MAG: hypothetical protein HQ515_12355 [Phycisphaeraceae bacterium]|nr:hypothetical protein [Phycisphaeraceae bacterium]